VAKIHVDRLVKKYGWNKKSYKDLMEKIIANNSENAVKKVGRMTQRSFQIEGKKYKGAEKVFTLPNLEEVFPKRSVHIIKGQMDGKAITDRLRDSLTRNLREVLEKPSYKKGKFKGEIKTEVLKEFEKKITKTFSGYTRRHPEYDMPSNIHNIAVTEVRSAVDNFKREYIQKFQEVNGDKIVTKTWKHNTKLLKNPKNARVHHKHLNGTTIPFEESFILKPKDGGTYKARHPHDSDLPAGEVISCQCECIYNISQKPKEKK